MRFKATLLGLLGLASALSVQAYPDDSEPKAWAEQEVVFPSAPRQENLVPVYVSAGTENRFLVDLASVSVGNDGVVRYTLVVDTGQARNVTYEGMRCETRERRLYASGRLNGSWSKSRNQEWEKIREAAVNRQYATLFLEYFCPWGVIVGSTAEAVGALKSGGHPTMKR